MQFQWSFYKDYIGGYAKNVVLVAITVFSTISGLVALIAEPVMKKGLLPSQWISLLTGILIGSLILAQGYVHYRLARHLIPGTRMENLLKSIAELREEGVVLHNIDPSTIRTVEGLRAFRSKFDEWHNKLIPQIQMVSPSQASLFRVLGTVPMYTNLQGDAIQCEVIRLQNITIEYATRIKDMVDRFSLQNLSNRVSH